MSEPIFMSNNDSPEMKKAYIDAQQSFKYFWREISWERRRIILGLDMTMIKLPFTDGPRTDGNSDYEFMWCSLNDFDGTTLYGQLGNSPNWLSSVSEGDEIKVPFSHLTDWLISVDGIAYGGFSVNAMRLGMGAKARKEHDDALGLDFGDLNNVRIEINRKEKKKGFLSKLMGNKSAGAQDVESKSVFQDHPMCVNMLEKYDEQLKGEPSIAQSVDERGWTMLHSEALAGNLCVVKLLIKYGAEIHVKTPEGKDAATLAKDIGWGPVAEYLTSVSK